MKKKDIKTKNKLVNILGQVRLYSLLDLLLFSYAIGAGNREIAGIALLHLSFLFYLEYTHKHSYRTLIPKSIWIILGIIGLALYPKLAAIGFILASMAYVRKNHPLVSPVAPLARGLQYYFLAAGIVGFLNPLAFLALGLMVLRNLAGDLRDIEKDSRERMMTLPVVMGMKQDWKHVHLITLFLTTSVWWHISGLSLPWLLGIFIVQIATYNITAR